MWLFANGRHRRGRWKNEDNLKNEDEIKKEDNLKNEDDLKMKATSF